MPKFLDFLPKVKGEESELAGLDTQIGKARRTLVLMVVGATVLAFLIWFLYDLLFRQSLAYLFIKIAGVFFGFNFYIALRKLKSLNLVAALTVSLLSVLILVLLLINGLTLEYYLFILALPLLVFLVAGMRPGIVWSGLVLAGMLAAFATNPELFSEFNSSMNLRFILTGAYLIIFALSFTFEKVRAETERDFIIKNKTLERLIYVISHDLRSPLTSIRGFVSFIKEDISSNNTQQAQHDIMRTEQAISSMEQMINDLLDLSRVGRGDETFEDVDVGELVDSILIESEPQLKEKSIQAHVQQGFPVLHTNRRKLEEIFRNLISNAIKYIGDTEQPQINVGVSESTFEYEFYVKDNGIGINPQEQEHLFELFYQADLGSRKGTGIGLSVVKGFVEDLGGRVWVESQEGQGSTFWFSLPKNEEE